jgi:hypothetical protein
MDNYWRVFAEEVPSDLGIVMTPEQIDQLAQALEGAHENYGLHSGRDIADQNWRANNDRELRAAGAEKVLKYLDERIAIIDGGPGDMFNAMNHRQKMAMHEIFEARKFLRDELVAV